MEFDTCVVEEVRGRGLFEAEVRAEPSQGFGGDGVFIVFDIIYKVVDR